MTRIIVILLLLSAGVVRAEQPGLWVLTNLEPPFSQQNERGQFEGIIIDIANGILQQADMEQQILAAPWERVFKEASSKANVMIFALARTPEREEQFHWVTPLTSVIVGVFSLQSPARPLTQLSELDLSQSIGVLEGDFRQNLLEQAGTSQIVVLQNWSEGVEHLLNGNIQNLFLSSIGIQLICQRLQRDCSQVKRVLDYQQITTYLALSKGTDSSTIITLSEAAKRYKSSKAFLQTANEWVRRYAQRDGLFIHVQDGVINLWATD